MRARRRRRISVQPRFFVILATLFVLITTPIIVMAVRDREQVLTIDSLTQQVQTDAVIIRKETVVAAQQTGQVEALVSEGDEVSAREAVASVYSANYDAGEIDELAQLRDDILTYQLHDILGDIMDEDLASLDAQIEEKTRLMADAVACGDTAQAKLLQGQIDELMGQREDYLRRNYRVDEELSSMLEEEEALSEKIDSWTTIARAPHAGRVSFYTDGCEHLLSVDMLDTLTERSLAGALSQASQQKVTQATEYTSLFRVVDQTGFYVVLPIDASLELVQGKTYTITIDSVQERFTATLLLNGQYAQNGLHVFYIEADPENVLRLRQVHITIEKDFEGICIHRRALYKKDGVWGVYVLNGKEKEFIPVTVLAREGKYIVIESQGLSISQVVQLK